jgi:hypothetical protein
VADRWEPYRRPVARDPPDRGPTRFAGAVASLAAALVVLAVAVSLPAGVVAGAGTALVGLGAVIGYGRAVDLGCLLLVVAVGWAGLLGLRPVPLVTAAAAAALAWEASRTARGLGATVGRATATTRVEAVRLVSAATALFATALFAVGLFRATGRGVPAAVPLLLVGAAVLAVALVRR